MAEKWDEGTNDSPEVVYEGFSPPTHTQGMMPATSSFVASDGNENNPMVTQPTQPTGFMNVPQVMEEQRESTQPEEADRSRMCFVCCNPVSDKNFETIKSSMNHSHAPLLVLLTDVLGYKLEEGRLHSQVVCKACYHLLDIIDELQQTLTESKTDVRTKFLETVQKLKLKYPRTDKMLKPRCLRCIQMSQSSARKRGRGRGWKGRFDDGRGRGRGRGKSRGHTQSNEGSDNDGEGQGVCEGDICKDVLPSKSLHPPSRDLQCSCVDTDTPPYECLLCQRRDTDIVYQYCECCLTCQGTFIPWGVDVTLRFVGHQCSISQINSTSFFNGDLICILTKGFKLFSEGDGKKIEKEDGSDDDAKSQQVESQPSSDTDDSLPKLPEGSSSERFLTKSLTVSDNMDAGDKVLFGSKSPIRKSSSHSVRAIRKKVITDYSDQDPNSDMEPDSCNIDRVSDEGSRSPPLKSKSKKRDEFYPDLSTLTPILKIQEGRKCTETFKKRKAKQSRKTLSEEFDCILSRPSLGKRKIKPTEKVKWLAEVCMSKRKDSESSSSPRKTTEIETKIKDEPSVSKYEDNDATSDKATKNGENENSDSFSSKASKKPKEKSTSDIEKEETVVFLVDNGKNDENEGKKDSDEEDHLEEKYSEETVVKSERLEYDDGKDLLDDKEFLDEMLLPGKRGRRPGRRRGRPRKSIYIENFEASSIIKLKDGKEIDLNTLSVKSLQNGKVYTCPICSKEYRSQGGMHYHLATHRSHSRYLCTICSYRTIRLGDLKKHFVIHTGLKPYKCKDCTQEFSTSSSYRRHLRLHTGEKPYKCDVCGKAFRNITTLKQHTVLHTGIKNFVCEVCGKRFALKHHYASHRNRHNGEMQFRCFYCDAHFKTHNAVKVHRKKEHPVEEAERIQQNRLRRRGADKAKNSGIKVEYNSLPVHEVYNEPEDVLVQAMAATVETDGVQYEYVDVTDSSIPVVSKMIRENWNGRDSVVLTITHVEEEEDNDEEDITM